MPDKRSPDDVARHVEASARDVLRPFLLGDPLPASAALFGPDRTADSVSAFILCLSSSARLLVDLVLDTHQDCGPDCSFSSPGALADALCGAVVEVTSMGALDLAADRSLPDDLRSALKGHRS